MPRLPDAPDWSASIGMIAIPRHELYDGRIYLQSNGRMHGADYVERANASVGVRAGFLMRTGTAGTVGATVYGMRGTSTAYYAGLAAPETATRALEVAGADLGWHVSLVRAGPVRIGLPIGPSLVWQRLRLSDGHRDAYAALDSLTALDVDWSDRTWTSLGAHSGLSMTVRLGSHLGLMAAGRGRFLMNRGSGSWGGQEERDIQRSTGRSVSINYADLIVLQGNLEAGLEWRH